MILVDFSAIGVAAVVSHATQSKTPVDEGYCKHLILNSVRAINQKFSKHFGEIHVCIDSKSWRRNVFPEYKANRAKDGKEKIDWDHIFKAINSVEVALMEHFPIHVHRTFGAEGDDIIGKLIRDNRDENIVVVTEDKDFYQFIRSSFSKVIIAHPRRKKLIFSEYVSEDIRDAIKKVSGGYELEEKFGEYGKSYLLEQIIRGDHCDGIPNILSDADTFVCKEKRSSPMTKIRLAELMSGKMTPDILKRFEQNKMLIQMTEHQPECPEINIELKELSNFNIIGVSQYLLDNGLMELYTRAADFFPIGGAENVKNSTKTGLSAWI